MNKLLNGKTHVIWDWNGTLLDDVGAALMTVNNMLLARGMQTIDLKEYYSYIDIPIKRFYERIFDLEREDYDSILREYNAGYQNNLSKFGLTKGVTSVLEHLKNSGVSQAVVSSSESEQLKRNIRKFAVEHYFDVIIGSDDFLAGSKLDRAGKYLSEFQIEPSKVLLIGDLTHDCEIAYELGMECVLISSGHQSEEMLRRSGAPVISAMEELLY